jgi:hypothetical protein
MSKDKMYAFNRNASTHASAIVRFAAFSWFTSFLSGIAVISTNILRNVCGSQEWMLVIIMGITAQVVVFVIVLGIMAAFYHLLNEQQAKPRSPSPTAIKEVKIPVFDYGRHTYDIVKFDNGGDD